MDINDVFCMLFRPWTWCRAKGVGGGWCRLLLCCVASTWGGRMVVVIVKFEKMQKNLLWGTEHVIWATDMALHRPELVQ